MRQLRPTRRGVQYLVAVAAPVAAAAFVVLYGRWTDGSVLYGTFAVAVFVTAIAGGLGPGLLATAVSAFLGLAILTGGLGSLPVQEDPDPARVAVLVVAGLVASLLGQQVHAERIRLEAARRAEARAHASSEGALARLAALQSLTVDLSRSLTTAEVAAAVVRHGRRALRAHGGVVYLRTDDGGHLDLAADDGYPDDLISRFRHVPLDAPVPAAVAVADGQAIFLGDPETYEARFARLSSLAGSDVSAAIAMVPLRSDGRSIGAIGWTFEEPQAFDEDRRSFILTMGSLCGQAMERARAYEAERAARERGDRLASREAERSAELASIIDAIGEGLLLVEPDGSVRSMNAAAERALGGPIRHRSELRERLRLDGEGLPPPGSPFGPAEYQLAGRPGSWVELTAYVVGETGSAGREPASIDAPVDQTASGRPTTVWLVRDVSAFRQGQRLREAFLGLLSHELRTPVTTIYAAANVLGRSGRVLPTEVRQDILEDIVGESNRLYRLVEDLLVLARFDEGMALGGDPNLVQHLARGVVASERLRWPAIAFEVEAEGIFPAVSGDETSIQQVIRNLLSNAAKYSAPGSTVRIVVEAEEGGASIRVLDDGIGIRVEELDQLFDPFYRSPASAKMAGGAGIGLYVCRRLVEAMGGRVWATPRQPRGSEFGFWLPAYEEGTVDTDDGLVPADLPGWRAETAPAVVEPALAASAETRAGEGATESGG